MVLPPTGYSKGRGRLGGGGDIHCFRPERCCLVHCEQNHHVSMSSGGTAPLGVGVPEVVYTEDHVPGRYVGVVNGGYRWG